ncbi:hypothetical protein JTB14_011277 [Gonioctena quinquepunctata]|nr:hypothetical protein JTB14_011277 [Gonioctena quinquepunctata]
MSFQKVSSWLLTDAGKKLSFYAAGTVTVGTLAAHFLPQTILLDQYKNIVQLYKNGLSVQLDPHLQKRFQKALELSEVHPLDQHLYKPFFSYGFDVMSLGSSFSKFGVIVGLPFNFSFDDPQKIDKSKIKINQDSITWESEEAQSLLNSLVLSENAQLFAMAREIQFRQTPKLFFDTSYGVATCVTAYGLSSHINRKFDFYAKPLGVRLVIYTLVEGKIDKELKEKNKIFAEGGKEYYTKILERNKALRHLLGKDGEIKYSVLGNENYLFRNKHLPPVQRKSIFEEQNSL